MIFNLVNNQIQIIPTTSRHYEPIMDLFNSLNKQDIEYLAYDFKEKQIKQDILHNRNCYIAIKNGKVVGFMRIIPGEYTLLDELVVHPKYRNAGIGYKMLSWYNSKYSKGIVKTKPDNITMSKMLSKYGYKISNKYHYDEVIIWVKE